MSNLGQPTVVYYGADGEVSTFTPTLDTTDADDSVPDLAMALDAAVDAIGDALDDGNMGQAQALQTAAETTSDALLDALGLPDADDGPEGMAG